MVKAYTTKHKGAKLPIFVEKDEGGFYVVECPVFEGCYTQGKTLDEALRNIREVIELILEEKQNREFLKVVCTPFLRHSVYKIAGAELIVNWSCR